MGKKKNINKATRSEILYYRMLILFAVLAFEIFGFFYATQTADRTDALRIYVAPIMALIFGALGICFFVLYLVRFKKGTNELYKVFSSGFATTLFLWIASAFALYFSFSEKRLIAYIVVSAAVFFIYYLYDREFFLFSLFTAIGGGLLSMLNYATVIRHYVVFALIAILCTICFVITVMGKNKKVEIKMGKSSILIFDKSYKAYPFYVSAGILLAGVILTFLLPNSLLYSLIVLFGYYLASTVVKTIQMM